MAYLPPAEEYAACSKKVFEHVKMEMASCYEPDLMGVWVLTQLSHWDHEWERVVVLSEEYLYLVEYDFQNRRVIKLWMTICFKDVTDISIGTLCYPEFTISPRRCNLGIKLNWGHRCCPKPVDNWNPSSMNVPYVVLMSHPLSLYKHLPKKAHQRNYSIFDFAWPFLRLIKASGLYKIPVANVPICIETYLGLGSVIYNSHEWGYDKVRKGYAGMFKCDTLISEELKLSGLEEDEPSYDEEGAEEEVKKLLKSFHCSRDDSPGKTNVVSAATSSLMSACGFPRPKCVYPDKKKKKEQERCEAKRERRESRKRSSQRRESRDQSTSDFTPDSPLNTLILSN